VVNRVNFFSRRGHDVFLMTPVEPVPGLENVTAIVRRPFGYETGFFFDCVRTIKRLKPDIVHVHYAQSPWGWAAALAGRHPLVVSVWGGDILFEEQGNPTALSRRLTLRLLEHADLITAKSHFLIGELDRLGGYGDKAVRVTWAIDHSVFRPADSSGLREKLAVSREENILLSPRKLTSFYNIHVLIGAMPRILARHPNTTLLVALLWPDDQYRAELESAVRELGLREKVRFIEAVDNVDMPALYSLATATLSVPESDGLPMTLFESMACGTPCIMSKLDRYREVVTDNRHVLFTDVNEQAVADTVNRLLSDEYLQQRLSGNARELVLRNFDLAKEIDLLEKSFFRLTSERRQAKLSSRFYFLTESLAVLIGVYQEHPALSEDRLEYWKFSAKVFSRYLLASLRQSVDHSRIGPLARRLVNRAQNTTLFLFTIMKLR